MFPFKIPFDPMLMIIMLPVLIIVMILVFYQRVRARTEPDMYGLIIDETDNTISLMKFIKIEDRIYAAIDTSYPLFMVVPPEVHSYQCISGKKKVPCFLAYARGLLALPLDPKVASAVSNLLSTEEMEEIKNEEATKILRYLYDLEEKKTGKIRISAPTTLAIAFDIKKILQEIINKVFLGASQAVSHFFASARNIDTLRKYLEALGAYAEKRHSWLVYVAIIIMVIGIVIAIMLSTPFFKPH